MTLFHCCYEIKLQLLNYIAGVCFIPFFILFTEWLRYTFKFLLFFLSSFCSFHIYCCCCCCYCVLVCAIAFSAVSFPRNWWCQFEYSDVDWWLRPYCRPTEPDYYWHSERCLIGLITKIWNIMDRRALSDAVFKPKKWRKKRWEYVCSVGTTFIAVARCATI